MKRATSYLLLLAIIFAPVKTSAAVAAAGCFPTDLSESCRKEHYTVSGYYNSLKVSPSRILLIEDGNVYFSLTKEEKPESSNAILTDETNYPAEFLKTDNKSEWLLIWCETHKTIFRILKADK